MIKQLLLATAIASSLGGCAVSRINSQQDKVEKASSSAGIELNVLKNSKPRSVVRFSDQPWVNVNPIKIQAQQYRAPQLACEITYSPESASTILEFSQFVSRLCGVPVHVSSDALSILSGGSVGNQSGGASGSQSAIPSMQSTGLPTLPGVDSSSGGYNSSGGASRGSIADLKYTGPLQGLLDTATSRLGVSWKYEDGGINIFYLETKSFALQALPSVTETKSSVQSGTSTTTGSSGGAAAASSGASGSSQTTDVSMKTNLIDDIKSSLQSMLTPGVGRLNVSASTGSVTVTDTPNVLAQISSYLDHENKAITQQVRFNIRVLAVSLNDSDSASIDWNLVNTSGTNKFGGALANTSTMASSTEAVSGTVNVLNGNWAGSSMLIKALSEQGRVSTLTTQSVTTLNLQPAPAQVATQTGYLASIETTTTDGTVTTSMTPGTITTGFNMSLLPYVMTGTEDMLLQYSVNLSSLTALNEFTSGTSKIQLPSVDNRIFSQRVKMRSGQTLILSGFEQNTDSSNKQGVGSANNILMGGGMNGSKDKQIIVIAITPVLMG